MGQSGSLIDCGVEAITPTYRHPGEGRDPLAVPAKAGTPEFFRRLGSRPALG